MVNNSVFAIVCSATPSLHNIKFFATQEGAQKHLKMLADERRNKLGVRDFEMDETGFSYVLGWEEAWVRFSIVEIAVGE